MNFNNIKAVVLAGGLGTRLRSAVSEVPKLMAPINGKPFLEYQIEYLIKHGFRDIILCVSFLKEKIMDYFRDGSKFGAKIEYGIEEEPLGTGGAIKNVEGLVSESFFVLNGDTYPLFDITGLVRFYYGKNKYYCLGIITLASHMKSKDKGTVELDKNGKVIAFSEKNTCNHKDCLVNAGVYLFNKGIFSQNVWEKRCSLEKDIFPKLVAKGVIFGMKTSGSFIDIGTPKVYKSLLNRQSAFSDLS